MSDGASSRADDPGGRDARSVDADQHSSDASPAEKLLAERLGEDGASEEALAEESGDPAAWARMLALHEIAERGLDALAERVAPEALDSMATGRRVGDYRLIEEIGSGGMGALYLARDEVLGRLVAVKLLTRLGASTEQRFRREAEIAASLDHPHIVDVFSRGVEDGVQYIAMRYVAGPDIAKAWRETSESEEGSKSRRLDRLVSWVGDAARALHYAHEQGVLHRDVKPGNILVEEDHVFVVDFGLATHEGRMDLTRTGDRLGTLPYMPPEQIRGDHAQLDRRVDVYGLGVTLYQLLSGRLPFTGANPEVLARKITRRDPPALSEDGVPRDLEAVVMRALEKDPDRRYATARELAEDLDRYILREPVRARRLGPVRRTFRYVVRRPVASALVLALVLGAGAAGLAVMNARSSRLRADTARYERALADADRGEYALAIRELNALRREGAEIPGLDETRARHRVLQLYDDLMRMVFIPREAPSAQISVTRKVTSTRKVLSELEELERRGAVAVAYRDRLRFIEAVVMRREGRRDEALALLDAWERDVGGPRRITVCARALVTMDDEGSSGSGLALVERISALPRGDLDDRYHAALAASRWTGAEDYGLREIERYLAERPDDYWARHTKGNLLRRLRRMREAREVYGGLIASLSAAPGPSGSAPRQTSTVSEKLAAAHWQRGLVSVRLSRFDEARRDFERAEPAVRDWALSLARAACERGLGDGNAALRSYRQALEDLDRDLGGERVDAVSRRGRSARVDIVRASARCLADLGRHEDALAEIDRHLGAGAPEVQRLPREAAILKAALRGDRLRRQRGSGPLTSEGLEDLVAFEASLAALVIEGKPHRDLDLLRAECAWIAERGEEALALLAPHLKRGDPEVIYYRAYWRYERAANVRFALFDRRLPANAPEPLRKQWAAIKARLKDDIRKAADDFGALREAGFASLSEVQDPLALSYIYGTLRLWDGQPHSARAILESLRDTSSFGRGERRARLEAQIARAARDAGDPEAAWESFQVATKLAPRDERIHVEMGRLAAQEGWAERALEALALMRERAFSPDFRTGKEMNSPVWSRFRDDERFAPYREIDAR